jgi:hypothetical protein
MRFLFEARAFIRMPLAASASARFLDEVLAAVRLALRPLASLRTPLNE